MDNLFPILVPWEVEARGSVLQQPAFTSKPVTKAPLPARRHRVMSHVIPSVLNDGYRLHPPRSRCRLQLCLAPSKQG